MTSTKPLSRIERVTVLAGGVGGARFLRGLLSHLGDRYHDATVEVTVVVNTGDDMWLNGLRVCPDLDTVMYTLAGVVAEEQGWGRARESHRTSDEITAYGRGWSWFTLGDLDLGTHIVRTDLLRSGATLQEATTVLSQRWKLGARLLPMSNQPVETHVRLSRPADEHAAGSLIHFEEWWVRYRAGIGVDEFVQVGLDAAVPAPGVVEALTHADVVILAPSNPVVSIGTILAVPGIRSALQFTDAAVVGISPIVGGATVRGMADACLEVIGIQTDAAAVGMHYGSRRGEGILDGWLVDEVDEEAVAKLEESGLRARAVPLWMTDVRAAGAMAAEALDLAGNLSRVARG